MVIYDDDENTDSMVAIIMMDEATLETMRLMHAILMRTQLTIPGIANMAEENFSAACILLTDELEDTHALDNFEERLIEVPEAIETPDEINLDDPIIRYVDTDFDKMVVDINGYVSFESYIKHSSVQLMTQAFKIDEWVKVMK
jgi:hypothetical protein